MYKEVFKYSQIVWSKWGVWWGEVAMGKDTLAVNVARKVKYSCLILKTCLCLKMYIGESIQGKFNLTEIMSVKTMTPCHPL